MTRRLITVEIDGTIMALRGWKSHGLALGAGLRPTYSGLRSAWVTDTTRLPDLLAYLQMRNIPVEVLDLDDRAPVPGGDISAPVQSWTPDAELDLFGGAS